MSDMASFRAAVTAWAAGGPGDPARELALSVPVRAVVLLEGPSDVAAVDALAASRGRDLAAEGVCVLPMGGAMSVGASRTSWDRPVSAFGSRGSATRRSGVTTPGAWSAAGVAEQTFFVCAADLEDELIRALGVARVEELVGVEGDLRALRTFLNQPATAWPHRAAAVAALLRHQEGPQDPLRPCPRRGPRSGPRPGPARRPAHAASDRPAALPVRTGPPTAHGDGVDHGRPAGSPRQTRPPLSRIRASACPCPPDLRCSHSVQVLCPPRSCLLVTLDAALRRKLRFVSRKSTSTLWKPLKTLSVARARGAQPSPK